MGDMGVIVEGAEQQARNEMLELVRGKIGTIPPALLVAQVMAATAGGDWPVRREAMQAVLRRWAFAKRDGLAVSTTPPKRAPLGVYTTKTTGAATRPYRTLVEALEPLRASCDCADFLRNSLGLCKHVLVILHHLYGRPRLLSLAVQGRGADVASDLMLRWDPVRPLTGAGDWLERLTLHVRGNATLPPAATRLFDGVEGGTLALSHADADKPASRLALVGALLQLIEGGSKRSAPVAAEPAVPALLRSERQRLQHSGDVLAPAAIDRALTGMKLKPYAYQREGVHRFLATGRLLLADDMGLGKTAQAIASCHVLWGTRRVQRGLLIVLASLKPQWLREWASFTDTPIEEVDGSPAERRAIYRRNKRGYLLINYEQLLRDFDEIAAWAPEIVVLDEAQRIKNWETKSATYVKSLDPRYRLVLTGTPMENRIDELASIYDWVDSFALEPKWRLAPWHVSEIDGEKGIGGARHLTTLRVRLAPTMLRRTRDEVLDQLPSRTDTVIPVDMTAEQIDEHDALTQPIASLIQRGRRRPLTQPEFLRLMQLLTTQRIIANGLAQLRFAQVWPDLAGTRPEPSAIERLATPKLIELRELIAQITVQQQRKVVVFSQWRRMLELAHWATRDVLADAGQRAVFFTGREARPRRTQNLIDLHDDPAVTVLFASDAGGVGLNLQKAASCCINIDLPWNPAVLEQRIGRIHRLGQKRPINVYNLVSQRSIEARIAALVADKKALFKSLFDGSSDEVHFDRSGSFLTQLERVVEPVTVPQAEDTDLEQEEVALAREIDVVAGLADENIEPAPMPVRIESPHLPSHEGTAPAPLAVADLFSRLQVSVTADGGIAIAAPPEAASSLAALFEGMARLLRSQSLSEGA
ncbi:MAG TPA: DEAD/DEAH box helicase [Terriglobales bacterium]|nr:DEAD/DEAH box helicase [Terriglobales bacterium]